MNIKTKNKSPLYSKLFPCQIYKIGGINDDDKNMVQIHDEQRNIQMTILHIYIHKKQKTKTKTPLFRQAL